MYAQKIIIRRSWHVFVSCFWN